MPEWLKTLLTVNFLQVIFYFNFWFYEQINTFVQSGFFQLRTLERLIHTFVSSCLDYCYCTTLTRSDCSECCEIVYRFSKMGHTPIMFSLHWLPIRYRIDFKILLFVFYTLNGMAPPYLSDLLKVPSNVI